MIEQRDTSHGVQYLLVHGTDSVSSDNEESLLETTPIAISPILAPAPFDDATTAIPHVAVSTPSALFALEESLNFLDEGQVRIKGILLQIMVHLQR